MSGPGSLTVLGASAYSTVVSGQHPLDILEGGFLPPLLLLSPSSLPSVRGVKKDFAETVYPWELSPMFAGRQNWQLSRPSLSPRLDSPFLGRRRHDIAPGLWQVVEGKPPHVKDALL